MGEQQQSSGEIAVVQSDAGRDRIQVQVRLDKVVLVVSSEAGAHAQAELTPDDARTVAEALAKAAGCTEQTPRS